METFSELLEEHRSVVERYVRFRIPSHADADDVLQEIYLNAFRSFGRLQSTDAFKAWLIAIARNCCNDWFRRKARQLEIPIDSVSEEKLCYTPRGLEVTSTVVDTVERLGNRDKQILYLFYWKQLPLAEIANRLGIPSGTVKSRLHAARAHFKAAYHDTAKYESEEKSMNKRSMPEAMPEYEIQPISGEPFEVQWEELMGWFIVPRIGEKLSWGLYDMPSHKCAEYHDMEVIGRAEVHGIEGVEIISNAHITGDESSNGEAGESIWRFIAQHTDTHTRYLAAAHIDGGVRKYHTFLDGDAFLNNWGFGEDNCGNEIHLRRRGLIKIIGDKSYEAHGRQVMDIVGRYTVRINGRKYDTICLMDIEKYNDGAISQQYIDENGRTILWRRFNPNDWNIRRYGMEWTRLLPNNERITVNGTTCVHWYDCITNYIFR